jgi:hypothetical protein
MSKTREKSKPLHEDLLLVGRPIGTKVPWHIAFDISEKEYMLFGSIVFYWSFLEHALRVRTLALARLARVPVPVEAKNNDFRTRLGAFRKLVEALPANDPTQQKWLKVVKRIERAKAGREHIAHNFWTYNPKKPDQLWSIDLRRKGARSEPFDSEKLQKLGRLLGEINFELMFPNKMLFRDSAGFSGSYMSRSFRLMMMGKPRLDDR